MIFIFPYSRTREKQIALRVILNHCVLYIFTDYSISDVTVPFLGQQLRPVSSAKDLGVILDCGLTFNDHILSLSSSLLFSLCQISRIRHLFSKEVLYIMINSIVFSKFFTVPLYGLVRTNRTYINYNFCRTLLPVY